MTSPVVPPFFDVDLNLCHLVFGAVTAPVSYPQAYSVSNTQDTERKPSAKEGGVFNQIKVLVLILFEVPPWR